MTDNTGDPNPYRLPFSREEYVAALSQVITREDAEQLAARLFEPQPGVIGITLMDGEYLLLAVLSSDIAQRIISTRPRLTDSIAWAQANRDEVIANWRLAKAGER